MIKIYTMRNMTTKVDYVKSIKSLSVRSLLMISAFGREFSAITPNGENIEHQKGARYDFMRAIAVGVMYRIERERMTALQRKVASEWPGAPG